MGIRSGNRLFAVAVASTQLAGCVMASTYNSMLAQQQAIESALRSEIASDQVEAINQSNVEIIGLHNSKAIAGAL